LLVVSAALAHLHAFVRKRKYERERGAP
jgi:hypothetical protein